MLVKHTLKPIYNEYSKVLILGSIPSIKSRENNFYYANKQNRFWNIINTLFNVKLKTNEEKREFLLNNNIALFDVIKECEINGSNDSSIKNIKINNIEKIINKSNIKYIFLTGKTAYNLYKKHFNNLKIDYYYLPSPSSANATYLLNDLIKEYSIIKEKLIN